MTVIKVADDKQPQIDLLATILERPDLDSRTRTRIGAELRGIRSGIQGEREAAYEIDFHYGQRTGFMVIHDLRLEFGGRVAQIDHLLINQALDIWVCETKAFSEGVRIDEYGDWYRYGGRHARGMASPIEQNRRHVAVLQELFDKGHVRLPRRIITLKPTLLPVVLVSNNARIDRPKGRKAASVDGLDTVFKVEQLVHAIERRYDDRNPVGILAKLVGSETIEDIARQLTGLHKPAVFNWEAKFGLLSMPAMPAPTVSDQAIDVRCESCGKQVTDKVASYAREHANRFGGAVLCWDCQHSANRRRRAESVPPNGRTA